MKQKILKCALLICLSLGLTTSAWAIPNNGGSNFEGSADNGTISGENNGNGGYDVDFGGKGDSGKPNKPNKPSKPNNDSDKKPGDSGSTPGSDGSHKPGSGGTDPNKGKPSKPNPGSDPSYDNGIQDEIDSIINGSKPKPDLPHGNKPIGPGDELPTYGNPGTDGDPDDDVDASSGAGYTTEEREQHSRTDVIAGEKNSERKFIKDYYYEWTFTNKETGESWTERTSSPKIRKAFSEPSTYTAVMVPWSQYEWGHTSYYTEQIAIEKYDPVNKTWITTGYRIREYSVWTHDSYEDAYSYDRKATYKFTISLSDVGKPIDLPGNIEESPNVVPIDNLVE